MSRCMGVLAIVAWSLPASAQPTMALKIEIDPSPFLDRVISHPPKANEPKGGLLVEAFYGEVKGTGVVLASQSETEAALSGVARTQDLRNSNQRLKEMAAAANVLYGVYALVSLDQAKAAANAPGHFVLKLKARVVSREGDVAVEQKEQAAPVYKTDPDTILAQFKVLAHELVGRLGLTTLVIQSPARRSVEAPSVAALTPDGTPTISQHLAPPPLPPLEDGSTQRLWGKIGVVGGAGVAVVGALLLGLAAADNSRLTPNTYGSLPLDQKSTAQTGLAKQSAGIGLIVGGGVVAGIGGTLWLLAPAAPVKVSAGPMGAGAGVFVGGPLP